MLGWCSPGALQTLPRPNPLAPSVHSPPSAVLLPQVHLRAGLAQARSEIIRLEALEKLASAKEHRDARKRAAEAAAARDAARARATAAAGVGSGAAAGAQPAAEAASSFTGKVAASAASMATAAERVADEIAGGVASIDVFGLVSRLRGALEAQGSIH